MNNLTIRPATAADTRALDRLAQLDSSQIPPAPQMIAFVDGELVAAMSTRDGSVIADPFTGTVEVVELMRRRARPVATTVRLRRLVALAG